MDEIDLIRCDPLCPVIITSEWTTKTGFLVSSLSLSLSSHAYSKAQHFRSKFYYLFEYFESFHVFLRASSSFSLSFTSIKLDWISFINWNIQMYDGCVKFPLIELPERSRSSLCNRRAEMWTFLVFLSEKREWKSKIEITYILRIQNQVQPAAICVMDVHVPLRILALKKLIKSHNNNWSSLAGVLQSKQGNWKLN